MNIQCRFLIKPFSLSLLLIASSYADEIDLRAVDQFRKCQKDNCSRVALSAQLTFGSNYPSAQTFPSISATGDQVYVVYNNNGLYTPTLLAAQLFDNVNGQLVSAQTLLCDPNYPNPWMGFASADFSLFSVLDGSLGTTSLPARIRILDSNFNQVGQRIFSSYQGDFLGVNPAGGFFAGGSFSEDNHYVVISTSISNTPPNAQSMLVVMDATNPSLPTVAQTVITGFPVFFGPYLFTLTDNNGNKNLYIQYTVSNGTPTRNFILFNFYEPPFYSQVYQVNLTAGTITLVAQQPLPKFAGPAVQVRAGGKDALICHGGYCALNPSAPSFYANPIPFQESVLPGDYAESRVFLFNGTALNLVVKEAVNCCNRTLPYPPSNGCSYLIGQNQDLLVAGFPNVTSDNQEFWCFADLRQGPNGLEFRGVNLPNQDMITAISVFSQDGNWLFRAGYFGYGNQNPETPFDDIYGLNNLLLFKVYSAPYTPICN